MDIRVSGVGMEVGTALTTYVKDHLNDQVRKYFEHAVNATVHFSKEVKGGNFKVNILINEGIKGGIKVNSDAEGFEVHTCFNEAVKKATRQLQRYKNKIKNYRRKAGGNIKNLETDNQIFTSPKYLLSPLPYEPLEEMEAEELEEMKEEEHLNIIEEKLTEIEHLSVQEAIMKMDLANLPALVFINFTTKRVNVVYHCKSGNISWIDIDPK